MSHKVEFRLSENPWAPTAVIEEVNARTGSGLVLTGLADQVGGTSSAAFVAWPDGRESAMTRTSTPVAEMRQTAAVLNEVRRQGLPVPAHQLVWGFPMGTSLSCRRNCLAAMWIRSTRPRPRPSSR
jgi:hypothetical protein